MSPPVRRWLPAGQAYTPPEAIWQGVAPMAEMLALARRGGRPLLGRRTARRWLKELGARRADARRAGDTIENGDHR